MSVQDSLEARAFNRMGRTDEQMAAHEARVDAEMYDTGYQDAMRVYAGKGSAYIAYAANEHRTRPGWRGDGAYERGMRAALDTLMGESAAQATLWEQTA